MYFRTNKFTLLLFTVLFTICITLFVNILYAFPEKSSFVILDYNSGQVLSEENYSYKIQPASLTKLMTLYILFEELEKHKFTLSSTITISRTASNQPPSKLWLKPGSTISVQDAINAMIVKSANDVAYAVAEFLSNRNVNKFVDLMNQKVEILGLKNTRFANPNGLSSANQYTTAYDMAILARNIMQKYSKYYYLFSQKNFVWNNYTYPSTNHLLNYYNVDGLKTGFTNLAGFNMVVSAQINGVRVIVSSLGNSSVHSRDNLVKQLVTDGIVVASNFLFSQIKYKAPPNQVLAANNSNNMNTKLQNNATTLINDLITSYNIDNNNTNNIKLVSYTTNTTNKNPLYIDIANPEQKEYNPIKKKSQHITKKHVSSKNSNYIQLGVFSNMNNAKKVVRRATFLKKELKKSKVKITTLTTKKNKMLYRVRLYNLTSDLAYQSCLILKKNRIDCIYIAYK